MLDNEVKVSSCWFIMSTWVWRSVCGEAVDSVDDVETEEDVPKRRELDGLARSVARSVDVANDDVEENDDEAE